MIVEVVERIKFVVVVVSGRRQQPFEFSSRAVNHKTDYYVNDTMSISFDPYVSATRWCADAQ